MATSVQLVSPPNQCPACHSVNPTGSRFCNQCGSAFDAQPGLTETIRSVLKDQLKDQKVLEIETTQLIVSRISDWAKLFAFFTAIPVTFLLGGLAIWGITKFTDVDDKLGKAQARAETLGTTSTALADKYAKLEQDFAKYQQLGNQLNAVTAKSDTLSAQLQTLKSDVSQIGKRVGFVPSAALTPDLQQRLQSSLASFEEYLGRLGYAPGTGQTQVKVVESFPSSGTVASFSQGTIEITSKWATEDPGNLLHEYMRVVLPEKSEDWAKNQSYHAVRLGLSCYFPASYIGRKVAGCQIVENARWPSKPVSSGDDINNSGNGFAGALWVIREKMSAAAVDRAAFQAWQRTQDGFQNDHYEQLFSNAFLGMLGQSATQVRPLLVSAGLLP